MKLKMKKKICNLKKVWYYDITSRNHEVIVEPYDKMLSKCYIIGEVFKGKKAIIVKYGGTDEDNDSCFDIIPLSCVYLIEDLI